MENYIVHAQWTDDCPCYVFCGRKVLLKPVEHSAYSLTSPTKAEFLKHGPRCDGRKFHQVLMDDHSHVWAFSIDTEESYADNWQWTDLRSSYDFLDSHDYWCAGKASQILFWDSHSRFCPACGTATEQKEQIMKKCPQCGYELYPPISTATIVLIRKGPDEVLLVHAHNFRGTFYGLVAGFVEAGETLEQCVQREVYEETGLEISNITYFGSQPWPYPSGLMVGFVADYAGGDIKVQKDELAAASFFHRDHLPEIPKKLSIARRLIDAWLERRI